MFISIYRKYLHYFERPCSHGMAKKTWLHERIIFCICDQGGPHDLAKFRVPMIHRFMTSHPVAELLLCFRAGHKDGCPMLFGFLVIFTYSRTELCILNAENVNWEARYLAGHSSKCHDQTKRFSIVLTINIMQLRGIYHGESCDVSKRVSLTFCGCCGLWFREVINRNIVSWAE